MNKQPIDRRDFLKESLIPAAALPLLSTRMVQAAAAQEKKAAAPADAPPTIIDTNVHLFQWPFRRLKYAETKPLLAKLRKHRIAQAWAGSFEAVLHKNLDGANARLTEECKKNGEGMLVPFGSVCPVWPDWEEDLRRCHEVYKMPGVRLYPSYHNYKLDHPEFAKFLASATQRGLIVQIAIELEDPRVHHPIITAPPTPAAPLLDVTKQVPDARVELLNCKTVVQGRGSASLVSETKIAFDISNLEGTGGIGRLLEGKHWSTQTQYPVTRLVFGSHAPFAPCEGALLRLFESPLERDQLVALMQGNAQRLMKKA
jgi:predicted TIM-barrel fold metal-dependent hydrolase